MATSQQLLTKRESDPSRTQHDFRLQKMTNEDVLITWHENTVKRDRGCVVWFTGLSGSGKSTIANCVDYKLNQLGALSL